MLPNLIVKKDNITVLNQFLGLNKGLHISETEFEDMKNMSNDYFPVIANRKKRGIIRDFVKPLGMLGGSKLSYIDAEIVEGVETDTTMQRKGKYYLLRLKTQSLKK